MSVTRRDTFKGFAVAAALTSPIAAQAKIARQTPSRGYGTDPKVTEPKVTWVRTMTKAQLQALAAVVQVVLPATDGMPSGLEVGVPAFVDEWVSAPYPDQQAARQRILLALAALDVAARNKGQTSFARSKDPAGIFHAAWTESASAKLLRELVQLVAGGYASSNKGMASIGYVGNVPLERFEGPPPQVIGKIDGFVAGLKS